MTHLSAGCSVTMHLDFLALCDALLEQELEKIASLVSLELDNGAPLFVLHDGTIAAPGLLELPQDLLKVQIVWQALHQRQALPRCALLEM
jgi:hypothetical protein